MNSRRCSKRYRNWCSGLLLGSLVTSASAEGLLSLKVENDAFSAGGDGQYTSGVEVIWAFEPLIDIGPAVLRTLFRAGLEVVLLA